ncbi:caffeine-induced death protein 2-domain-containing protein, partial [Dipodascopsis tothii]|uniref:caffeine-induced death protein 2-domain-containing protein n=1 Tax=Dipodascopsis tothii TaxID=44089 RepID=UPI0034CF54B0
MDSPQLTPRLCLDGSHLRSFLRLSRAVSDDVVSASISDLPATGPPGAARRRVCAPYVDALVAHWAARDRVLDYCTAVALDRKAAAAAVPTPPLPPPNLRLDPYADRAPPPPPEDRVLAWIDTERQTEMIVRPRTWGVVADRCSDAAALAAAAGGSGATGDDWQAVYAARR